MKERTFENNIVLQIIANYISKIKKTLNLVVFQNKKHYLIFLTYFDKARKQHFEKY